MPDDADRPIDSPSRPPEEEPETADEGKKDRAKIDPESWREESIPRLERAKLLQDEYKFRQTHIWNSFNRFSLAIVALWIVPWVYTSAVQPLGWFVLVFPALALFASLYCWRLIMAEYVRLAWVKESYDEAAGFVRGRARVDVGGKDVLLRPIGPWLSRTFRLWYTALSVLDALALAAFRVNH